ncbi:hypothetical protein [Spirochaeta isovalerica]|uniref:Fibronectin type-III domain-containing protein n=1 Tax=Spirochaeta isovalerica TaxID=150 RepID=A0A841R539_9SPIO|nr:hypothetical protein [Spirochaeta isovalerica]MBB6478511.1 hypothetical protein [Spirochaeta isovalerica]
MAILSVSALVIFRMASFAVSQETQMITEDPAEAPVQDEVTGTPNDEAPETVISNIIIKEDHELPYDEPLIDKPVADSGVVNTEIPVEKKYFSPPVSDGPPVDVEAMEPPFLNDFPYEEPIFAEYSISENEAVEPEELQPLTDQLLDIIYAGTVSPILNGSDLDDSDSGIITGQVPEPRVFIPVETALSVEEPEEVEVPPVLILLSPAEGSYYRSKTVISLAVFNDDSKTDSSRIVNLFWIGEDREKHNLEIEDGGISIFSIDSSRQAGPLIITVRAEKNNGLTEELIIELQEDTRGPSIALQSKNRDFSDSDSLLITGSVSPGDTDRVPLHEIDSLRIVLNGFEDPVNIPFDENGDFSLELTDEEMADLDFITIESSDKNGHLSRLDIPVQTRLTASGGEVLPYLNISSPESGSLYFSRIDIRGVVSNSKDDEYADRIKELTWSMAGETGENRINFNSDGSFNFRIAAVDMNRDLQILFKAVAEDGGEATFILPLVNDHKGPEITLETPQTGDYFNNNISVKGIVKDQASGDNEVKSLYWSVSSMADERNLIFFEDDGSFEFNINTETLDGKISFRITAADLNNNISHASVELNDGKKTPVIVLRSPGKEDSYGAGIRVSGKISDPYGWNPQYGGIESLYLILQPADSFGSGEILNREIIINADNSFDYILPVTSQKGDQKLELSVKAKNGNSSVTSLILPQSDFAIPDFSAKQGDGRLTLDWTALPFIDSYYLSVRTADSGFIRENVNPPLVFSGLENGALYEFELKGQRGEDIVSSPVISSIPLNDATLEPYAKSEYGFIEISWIPVKGADAYRVFRTRENEAYIDVSGRIEDSRFIDRSGVFGVEYTYKVVPFGYEDIPSYSVSGRLLSEPPVRLTEKGSLDSFSPEDLVISGDYAYAVSPEDGFYIIDINDSGNLSVRGFVLIEGGQDISLLDEYALVAAGSEGFYLINISEPAQPRIVSYRKTTDARAAKGMGKYIYIADGIKGLKIYSLSNPLRPPRISFLDDFPLYDLYLSGKYIYGASGEEGLILIDVTDPYYPEFAGRFGDIDVYSCVIRDDFAYVASLDKGVSILDISDTDNIFLCSTYKSNNARRLSLKGNHLYIADGDGGVVDIDITDPYRPVSFENMKLSHTSSVDSKDNLLVVADRSGLKAVETFQYGQSFKIGELKTGGNASSVEIRDGLLYISDHSGGLVIVDASDPQHIAAEDILHVIPSEFAQSVFIDGGRLYLADSGGGVKIFAMRENELLHLSTVETAGQARSVRKKGEVIYIASGSGGIQGVADPYDIFPETQPLESDDRKIVKRVDWSIPLRDARDIETFGDFLYCADRQTGLIVFSNNKGAVPEEIRSIDLPGAMALAIEGGRLLAAHSGGVTLFDLSDPAYPEKVRSIDSPYVEDIYLSDSLLYTAEGHAGVSVYEIKDKGSFVKVSECPDVFADSIAVEGDYAFVADSTGVNIIRIYIPDWIRNP